MNNTKSFEAAIAVLILLQNAPGVLVKQVSLDVEQFCHELAQRVCTEANKKYFFCNDYNVEIVEVSMHYFTSWIELNCFDFDFLNPGEIFAFFIFTYFR